MNIEKVVGWDEDSLENLLEYYIGGDWGKDPEHQDDTMELAYCIRGSEMRNWNEDKGKTASLRKIKKTNVAKRKLIEGDILVEISGGGPDQPVGRTVLIDKSSLNFESAIPKICTNFLRLIRPKDSINSKYLNLYLKLFYNSGEIVKYQNGSNNLRNLIFPEFLKIEVPFPSFDEQHQIVEKIEELFSELDKGIENLKIAQQQLKVYRQAVLKWAFEGKLIDDNSKWLPFNLANIINGFQNGLSKRNADEGVPFNVLRLADIKDGGIRSKEPRQIKLSVSEIDKYKVDNCDLLVIRVNGSKDLVGKFILCNGHSVWAFCDHFIRVRPNVEMVNPVFIKYFTETQLTRKYIEDNIVSSAGQNTISQTTLSNIEISLPSIEIQKQIIQEIESRLSVCDKMEETITNSLQQAEALRQSILKRAFEGKLVRNEQEQHIISNY